jgi:hypothetical protein
MSSSTLKWFPFAALLLGVSLSSSASYRIVLEMAVCMAAIVVVARAVRIRNYMWAAGFLVISILFNPALPVPLSHRFYLGLEWFSIGAFLVSLAALRSASRLSVLSITARAPGTESL